MVRRVQQESKRSSIVNLHKVRQLNGDLRVDDGDEGPMVKVEFFDVFASRLSDEDKDQIMEAVLIKASEILNDNPGIATDKDCDRRGAVAATRANSAE
jgi:hypothetical protein